MLREVNFLRYSSRDLVELLVTKTIFLPGGGSVVLAGFEGEGVLLTPGSQVFQRLGDALEDVVAGPDDAW